MAMLPLLTIQNPNVIVNQATNMTLTIANTGVSSLSVTGVQLLVKPTSFSASGGAINLGPNVSTSISGSASLSFPMSVVFQAPRRQSTPGSSDGKALVNVVCTFSDGSVAVSPLVSVAVNITGNTPVGSSALTGQMRFDSGPNSDLIALLPSSL